MSCFWDNHFSQVVSTLPEVAPVCRTVSWFPFQMSELTDCSDEKELFFRNSWYSNGYKTVLHIPDAIKYSSLLVLFG